MMKESPRSSFNYAIGPCIWRSHTNFWKRKGNSVIISMALHVMEGVSDGPRDQVGPVSASGRSERRKETGRDPVLGFNAPWVVHTVTFDECGLGTEDGVASGTSSTAGPGEENELLILVWVQVRRVSNTRSHGHEGNIKPNYSSGLSTFDTQICTPFLYRTPKSCSYVLGPCVRAHAEDPGCTRRDFCRPTQRPDVGSETSGSRSLNPSMQYSDQRHAIFFSIVGSMG